MEEELRQRLTSRDLWIRGFYMVLFSIAYSMAKVILVFLVIFQFVTVLATGRANEPLLRFGNNLASYIYDILEFQTFNTEVQPFPFSPWPDEEPGGEQWLDGDSGATVENDSTPLRTERADGNHEDGK